MNTLELLESLNPEPDHRGNPGPLKTKPGSDGSSRGSNRPWVNLAMRRCVGAAVLLAGFVGLGVLVASITGTSTDDSQTIQVANATEVPDAGPVLVFPTQAPSIPAVITATPAQSSPTALNPTASTDGGILGDPALAADAPDLDALFTSGNQPYFDFRGTTNPIETAEQFLASQFPEWSTVDLQLFEWRERSASVRWTDTPNATAGWIAMFLGDGFFRIMDMTTDGFSTDLWPTVLGARGHLSAVDPIVVEIASPLAAGEVTDLGFDKVTITDTDAPIPVVIAPDGIMPQAIRLLLFRGETQVGGAIVTFEIPQPFDSRGTFHELVVVTRPDQTEAMIEVLWSEPSLFSDAVTFDIWQSVDQIATLVPDRSRPPIAEVPREQLTHILLRHPTEDPATQQLIADLANTALLVEQPATGRLQPDVGAPAEQYVVESVPTAMQCASIQLATGNPPQRTTAEGESPAFSTPLAAAQSVPWNVGDQVVEFVDTNGRTLGFGSLGMTYGYGPRSFLSVIALDQATAGWSVNWWEVVGC